MSTLSYQEKSLYLQLTGLIALVAFYLHFLVHSGPGGHWLHAFFIVFLFLLIVFRALSRRHSGDTLTDERDLAIRSLGARWSNTFLYAGIAITLVLYYDHGSLHSAGHLINLLFHLLIFAASLSIIRQIVAYRTAL